jgi:iron complex outermembrane recepter protein
MLAGEREIEMLRRIRTVALAAVLLFACRAFADEVALADDVASILVTATRFEESDPRIPANVSVITREDIHNTPATNVPDLLKATAGIEVRPLYGPMGIDATVDLRGFGETAGSNTLILVDGQRLNPIDSGGISWSTIPLAGIERIEVIRGFGTVLYGDQATGGIINIITDKSGKPTAAAQASGGSYGYRDADAQVAGGVDGLYFNLVGHYAGTDGWRQNSQADQQAASARIGRPLSDGDLFADATVYKDSNGLPGYLLSNDYRTNPTRAQTPNDNQKRDGYRLRPGLSLKLSDSLSFDAEVGFEHENYHANDVSFASVFLRRRDTLSATPRLRWLQDFGGVRNQTVVGLDYYGGKVDTLSLGSPSVIPDNAKQNSQALYLQNILELSPRWSVTLGAREQRVGQEAQQSPYPTNFGAGPATVPGLNGSETHTRTAVDLGPVFQSGGWRAFARFGTTFRFPTTDELFGYDPFTGNPVFAGALRPQRGTIGEVGGSFTSDGTAGRLSTFRMDLNDEIGFDATRFTNVNLAATRRQGVEAEIDQRIIQGLKAHAAYTFTDAKLREGINTGNELPLVARNKASMRLTWEDRGFGAYSLATTTVGERRYGGDFANAQGNLAGYTTVDLQGSWKVASWTITAKLINALDRRYAPFAGYSTFINDHYYYPADARSVFVGARYDFL